MGKKSPNMSHTKCYIQTGINLGKTRVTSCIEWFQFFIIDSVTVKASKSFSQFAPFRRDLGEEVHEHGMRSISKIILLKSKL